MLKNFFNNAPIMALLGVLVGSLIAGFFAFKTQDMLIAHQQKIYEKNYTVERNKNLRADIKIFIDYLSSVIYTNDSTKSSEIVKKMTSVSLQIMLLTDFKIGTYCLRLTEQIRQSILNKKLNHSQFDKMVAEWGTVIKTEMKIVDYKINSDAIKSDLLQLLLFNNIDSTKQIGQVK